MALSNTPADKYSCGLKAGRGTGTETVMVTGRSSPSLAQGRSLGTKGSTESHPAASHEDKNNASVTRATAPLSWDDSVCLDLG